MSHRIEFDFAAWRIPAMDAGTPEDQFVVASLGGDNNVIAQSGAVARKWSANCLGTKRDVIRQACMLAKSCEGGSVQLPGRKWISPENYIARYRRLLDDAPHISEGYKGEWFTKTFLIYQQVDRIETVQQSNPDVIQSLYAFKEPAKKKDWYSEKQMLEWTFTPEPEQLRVFFAALPVFLRDSHAWSFCKIRGPGEK